MKRRFFSALVLSVLFVIFGVFDLIGQSSDDRNACEFAKKDSNVETWKFYLENFPNGECSAEAKAALQSDSDSKDQTACNKARQQNSFDGWEQYLKNFPNGKCNFEAKVNMKKAKVNMKKVKKIGNIIWSDRSSNKMDWSSSKQYCENLTEGGVDDWRLPTISELRTTIKNCQSGGSSCRVSDSCLSFLNCFSESCYCDYKKNNGGYYSKLGDDDNVWLWSSSVQSDNSATWQVTSDDAWSVSFDDGTVRSITKSFSNYVRCVR